MKPSCCLMDANFLQLLEGKVLTYLMYGAMCNTTRGGLGVRGGGATRPPS